MRAPRHAVMRLSISGLLILATAAVIWIWPVDVGTSTHPRQIGDVRHRPVPRVTLVDYQIPERRLQKLREKMESGEIPEVQYDLEVSVLSTDEMRKDLAAMKRKLGDEHPYVLLYWDDLVSVLCRQQQFTDALAEEREILAIRARVLGSDHPDTIQSRKWVAYLLRTKEEVVEAEQEFRTLLSIQQRVLGPEHIDVIETHYDLATVLREQERYQEAQQHLEVAYAGRLKVLGEEHPDTIMVREFLADITATAQSEAEDQPDR
jgi:tetratricopeptide (TPR) repeat protein